MSKEYDMSVAFKGWTCDFAPDGIKGLRKNADKWQGNNIKNRLFRYINNEIKPGVRQLNDQN